VLKRFKNGVTGRALVAPERKKENPYLWASSRQPHTKTMVSKSESCQNIAWQG
jgi:hypothetical protein